MRGKTQQKLGRADGEGAKQPRCSECHFHGAQKYGERMEEEGRDAVGKTPLQGTDSKRDAQEAEKKIQAL